jgi:hypothetical protein
MTAVRVTTDDATYTHLQSVPVSTVLVTHNLGKYAAVDVITSDGELVDCRIEYLDMNRVRVTISGDSSFRVTCN